MSVLLPILAGTLPPGYCFPASPQQLLVDFADNMQAVLESGLAFYNYGDTVPDPQFNSFPWLRTIDMRWYRFDGDWLAPVNYDANDRRFFVGDLTALQTYDGGDATPPSDRSGPMWEEDIEFRGRSPMGPGDIPGSDPAKTLALLENYGDGSHAQAVEEMVPHRHYIVAPETVSGAGLPNASNQVPYIGGGTGNENYVLQSTATDSSVGRTSEAGGIGTPAAAQPVNMVHPVRGIYLIKWTGRLYRKV